MTSNAAHRIHRIARRVAGRMYLTGASTADSRSSRRRNLGLLAQPDNKVIRDVAAGHYTYFGADNAFYGLGSKADPTPAQELAAVDKWLAWLAADVAPLAHRCLFATVPDVLRWVTLDNGKRIPVGDAEATLARYLPLAAKARALGLPAALVAQDGLSFDADGVFAGAERIAWADLDAVFVGGSDDYKLGDDAAALCREAQRRGLWVHVGRVNSRKRAAIVATYVDSVDGTLLAFGPSANWPRLTAILDLFAAPTPEPLFSAAA